MVGYIVLPPGHGKSYRHDPSRKLLEAGSLVGCKSTNELAALRKVAWETNDWSKYDPLWGSEIQRHLPTGRCVVMIPASSVGNIQGWVRLGSARLCLDEWESNLRFRKGSVAQYRASWEAVAKEGGAQLDSNQGLDEWVNARLAEWLFPTDKEGLDSST